MPDPEYVCIKLSNISEKFINKYNLSSQVMMAGSTLKFTRAVTDSCQ